MSLLPRRLAASSRSDLIIGAVVSAAVLGLAVATPSKVGQLLAALAVAILVAVFALSDPVVALVLVFASSFLRLAQKEIVSTELLTPAFLGLILALAIAVGRRTKRWPQLGVVEWLMAAYVVWNLMSWMLPHELEAFDPATGIPQDIYRWIFTGVLVPFAIYVLAKSAIDDERGVRWVLWAAVWMTAYSCWVSILQFHGPQSLIWPRYIVTAPNWVGRANGVFNQPVLNGFILAMGFVVCLFLASRPGVRRWVQVMLYGIAAASAYSVYLTHTRVSLLILVLAIAMGIVFAAGWRRAFVVSALLGVAAVVANASSFFSTNRYDGGVGSSTEVYDRLNIIATGLRAISEHPFIGIGIARFLPYNTWYHQQWSPDVAWRNGYNLISHETDIGIAAELGIPGLLLWLGVVVVVLYLLWRAMRELPRDEFFGAPLALMGMIMMIAMLVNGFTVDLRVLDFATFVPFLFAGMVIGQLERHRARARAPRPGTPGGGLPDGMSAPEQRAWWDAHPDERRATSADRGPARPGRPADRPLEPAR